MVNWYEQFTLHLFLWQQADVADDADSVSSCGGSTEYYAYQQQQRQHNQTDKKIFKTGFRHLFCFTFFTFLIYNEEPVRKLGKRVRRTVWWCGTTAFPVVCVCVCVRQPVARQHSQMTRQPWKSQHLSSSLFDSHKVLLMHFVAVTVCNGCREQWFFCWHLLSIVQLTAQP